MVLLAGAGLMLRTVWSLGRVIPGFNPRQVVTFSVGLSPASTSSSSRILQTFQQTVDSISNVPGVRSAAVTSLIPLGGSDSEIPFYMNGRPRPTSQGDMLWALLYATSPGYLKAMDIPLLRGRYIEPQDMQRGSPRGGDRRGHGAHGNAANPEEVYCQRCSTTRCLYPQ